MDGQDGVDFLGAARKRWPALLIVTLLAAVLGFVASMAMPRVYQGSASLLVGDFAGDNVTSNTVQASQSLASTYADVARREPILAPVAKQLGLASWRNLAGRVHVRVPRESQQVIEIDVEGSKPAEAEAAAGAVAARLMQYAADRQGGPNFVQPQLTRLETSIDAAWKRIDELQKQRDAATASVAQSDIQTEIDLVEEQISSLQRNYVDFKALLPSSSNVAVRRLDPAYASNAPISPNVRFNTVIAGFVGLVLALSALYLWASHGGRPEQSGDRVVRMPLIPPPGLSQFRWPVNGQDAGTPAPDKPRTADPRRP